MSPGIQKSEQGKRYLALTDRLKLPLAGTVIFLIGAYILFYIPFFATGSAEDPWQLGVFHKGLQFGFAAIGLNLILRHTREVSFGHAAFFGIGAYTFALLVNPNQPPAGGSINEFWVLMIAAAVVATLLAAVIGFLTLRHSGLYFSLLTLAFGQLVFSIMRTEWFGGTDGFSALRPAREIVVSSGEAVQTTGQVRIFGQYAPPFEAKATAPAEVSVFAQDFGIAQYRSALLFWISAAIVIVGLLAMWRIVNSPFGKALDAIGQNTTRARFIGIPTKRYIWGAFVISGIYGGIAGGLYTIVQESVRPEPVLHAFVSGDILFMAILGGYQTLIGPLVGGFIFEQAVFAGEIINIVGQGGAKTVGSLVTGVLLIVIIFGFPRGFMGSLTRVPAHLRLARERRSATSFGSRVLGAARRGARGFVTGAAAFFVGLLVTFWWEGGAARAFAGSLGEAVGAQPSDLQVVGWIYTQLHNGKLAASVTGPGGESYVAQLANLDASDLGNAMGQSGLEVEVANYGLDAMLLYMPIILLTVAGYLAVRGRDLEGAVEGMKASWPVTLGFFVPTVLLLMTVSWQAPGLAGAFEIGPLPGAWVVYGLFGVVPIPLPGPAILIMGLAYPLLFASLGGGVAASHLPSVATKEAGRVRAMVGGWAGENPLGVGVAAGVVSYLAALGYTYVSRGSVAAEFASGLGQMAPAQPSQVDALAWFFNAAHNTATNAQIRVESEFGGFQTTVKPVQNVTAEEVSQLTNQSAVALPDFQPGVLDFYVPVLVLVVAGLAVASYKGADGWFDGAKAAWTVFPGYLVAALPLAIISGWRAGGEQEFVQIGTKILSALVVMGLVYPLLFAGLGGVLAGASVSGVLGTLGRIVRKPIEVVR